MTTYKISPLSSCSYCHGTGEFGQVSEAWGYNVVEWLICDCVLSQLPDDYDEDVDNFELEVDGYSFGSDGYEEDEDYLLDCYDAD